MPKSRCSCAIASTTGVLAVITMEAGWVVSEVGRQPWIVYNLHEVEDAATGNTGVWITFVASSCSSTSPWPSRPIYVLRGMSRRFRDRPRATDVDVPYGPTDDAAPSDDEPAVPVP